MKTQNRVSIFSGSSSRVRYGKKNKHFNINEITIIDSVLSLIDLPFVEHVKGTKKFKQSESKKNRISLEFRMNDSQNFEKHDVQSGVSGCIFNDFNIKCDVLSIFIHKVALNSEFDDLGIHSVAVNNQNSFADAIVEIGFIDNDNFVLEHLSDKDKIKCLAKSLESAFLFVQDDIFIN